MGIDSPNQAPLTQPSGDSSDGGLGSLLADDNKYARRKSVGLASRAVSERWHVPPETEKDLPAAMLAIALNSKDEKNRIAAGGVVVKMIGQNQADEHLLHKTTEDGEEKSTIRVVFEDRLKGHTHDQQRDRLPADEAGKV